MLIPQQKLNVPKIVDLFRFKNRSNKQILEKFVPVGDKKIYWTGSGRCALKYILEDIKQNCGFKDHELNVGLPSFTCHVVLDSVLRAKCKPIFIDSGEIISITNLEEKIKKIDALVLPYNFGFLPDIEKIKRICYQNGTIIIEDCAQAFGARYKNRLAGSFGDYSFYSFGISKNIGFMGGMILSNNKIAVLPKDRFPISKILASSVKSVFSNAFFNKRIYPFSSLLLAEELSKSQRAMDYKLPEFCQNTIVSMLRNYGNALRIRTENAEQCIKELAGAIDFIRPIKCSKPSWLYFVLLPKNRAKLIEVLRKESVELMPLLTYCDLSREGKLAKQIEQQHCCFALYRSSSEIDLIIKKIKKVCKDGTY